MEESRVSFAKDCVRLDFGAIGKGYAVDEIVAIARKNGITRGLVNFGGNMFAMGSPPGLEAWEVQVAAPGGSGSFISRLDLREMRAGSS